MYQNDKHKYDTMLAFEEFEFSAINNITKNSNGLTSKHTHFKMASQRHSS